ncbi:MAG TPA: hypothetical protein VHD35_02705 [Chitinophagaceae bacterium]|nr:hypothetical protein [Chitinophagaceae bacterium]
MAKKKKLPADTNKRAKSVVDLATQEKETINQDEAKTAAQQLGRLGGLKGGKARAKALSAKRRSEIAKKAAAARWGHTNQ